MTIRFTETASAAQSAQALAQAVAQNLRDTLATQERATLAVSGGKSPIAFFQALSRQDLDWARVNITLVDERIVPTAHVDSNTGLVRQHLLQNRAAAAQWLPLVADNADEGSLKNHEQALAFALSQFKQPDVLVLGMGGDGHTASLFPQAPQLAQALAADNPQPLAITSPQTAPHERITLTLAAIERTPHCYLALGGGDKLRVLQQAEQGVDPELPVSFVLHSAKADCHVITHP